MVPKIIWRYWETGWDTIKWPLQDCTESVKHYAPDWEIRDLDKENIKKYIDLPENAWKIPVQTRSDLIRIMLLAKYGGCWIDATIFLNTNLTDYLETRCSDFFCYWRWPSKVTVSSWFLVATDNSIIANKFEKVFMDYVLSESFISENIKYYDNWINSPNYFCFHHEFENYIKKDNVFKQKIDEMPFESSVPIMLPIMNDYCKSIPLDYFLFVINDTPMFKFSHKRNPNEASNQSIIPFLIDKMRDRISFSFQEKLMMELPRNSMNMRTSFMYNSFLDKPDCVKEFVGVFESESDMKLSKETTSSYHVYNFSSKDYKNNCQILIPYGQNRIYFRKQKGKVFDEPQELIFKSELDEYKKLVDERLSKLESKRESISFFKKLIKRK